MIYPEVFSASEEVNVSIEQDTDIGILQEALTLLSLGRSAATVNPVLAEQMGRELVKADTLGTRSTIMAIRREPGGAVCGSPLPTSTRDFDS